MLLVQQQQQYIEHYGKMSNCCVVGCRNTYRNTTGVVFYCFPSEKNSNGEQRRKWIRAVNRTNPDGSDWEPKKHTRICSQHFVGGKKRDDPGHPAYVPTVRLPSYEQFAHYEIIKKWALEGFNRAKQRREKKLIQDLEGKQTAASKADFGVQTDGAVSIEHTAAEATSGVPVIFFCRKMNNDAETQATLPILQQPIIKKNPASIIATNTTENKSHSASSSSSFHGYSSVTKDELTLKEFSGVTETIFSFLLGFLPEEKSRMPLSKENQLLLFLMKMKLGLHDAVLGALFGIQSTNANECFKHVLSILYENTRCLVCWSDQNPQFFQDLQNYCIQHHHQQLLQQIKVERC